MCNAALQTKERITNFVHRMKSAILLMSAIIVTTADSALGLGRNTEFEHLQPEKSDTSFTAAFQDSFKNIHWLMIDIFVGGQFLNTKWEPYSKPLFVGGSCQRRFDESSLWLDASILVGRAGGVDQAGAGNGPGVSLVDLRAGLGHWWNLSKTMIELTVRRHCE